uniref:Dual OB-containing domain-containing protein n=1 Tax=Candidatus Kentrum sp. LFY TaxID=2126342 RepID=A0A450UNV8_9GAMM|nr:MAG: hypothetical protein BECKLFY1418A_GA0070994_10386 [Candidatus Kentron sp. LFY]
MKKQIVVFANSVKHGKHCVAGKDISTKEWIRPVDDRNGAELNDWQCTCVGQRFPVKPLQEVEIDIAEHSPLVNQPENYLIVGGQWNQRYKLELSRLPEYLDSPDSLWGEGDRVEFASIENGMVPIKQSLYLVEVDDLKIYRNNYNKLRARFSYNEISYDLAVTDLDFDEHLSEPRHQSVLCVSLGEKFKPWGSQGYFCYKIVAAII